MKAQVLRKIGGRLELEDWPKPSVGEDELLIKVKVCGVCRTDLHIIDGDLPAPKLPLILGHQIVGVVEGMGAQVSNFKVGERVGVPWLGGSCGDCHYCLFEHENLCDNPTFTGYNKNGGYAEYVAARADYCFRLPSSYSDLHVAPLLCAGFIGYRAYKIAREARHLVRDVGLYGFGSAARILIQLMVANGHNVYVFTRPGDKARQEDAMSLGAIWAGGSDEVEADRLDAAIIFASAGELIPLALRNLRKGGAVVSAEIHMSDIPSFPYNILWNERSIHSVANLTRADGWEFLEEISEVKIETKVREFSLEEANDAIECLRSGKAEGSVVLSLSSG